MGALVIELAKGKHGEPDGDGEAPEDVGTVKDAFNAASDAAFDAVKSGDKKAFRDAFRDAVDACMMGGYEEEE